MAKVNIGRGFWLDELAAASFDRCLEAGAPFDMESAGRPWASQMALWVRYGSPRAVAPWKSLHVVGRAIDARPALRDWFLAHPEFGWIRTTWESWHFQYFPERDTRAHSHPTAVVPLPILEEEPAMRLVKEAGKSAIYEVTDFSITKIEDGEDLAELEATHGSWEEWEPARLQAEVRSVNRRVDALRRALRG